MIHPDPILQELKELSSILPSPRLAPQYGVPSGYFDGLAGEVMNRIRAGEAATPGEELMHLSPLLNSISRKLPYTIRHNYFEQLAPAVPIADQTPGEELETLSPLLNGLAKQSPYSVPPGYFDQLEAGVKKEDQATPAKVVPMGRRNWSRYAAAAVVIGLVALGGLFLFNKNQTTTVNIDKQPYAWIESKMKKVSTDEINQFVELVDEQKPVIAQVSASEDIRKLMKNVPDNEIQDFLDDTQSSDPTSDEEDVILN